MKHPKIKKTSQVKSYLMSEQTESMSNWEFLYFFLSNVCENIEYIWILGSEVRLLKIVL